MFINFSTCETAVSVANGWFKNKNIYNKYYKGDSHVTTKLIYIKIGNS